MDINRNQVFLAGVIVAALGLQFLMVDAFVLTPEFTQLLAEKTNHPLASVNAASAALPQADGPMAKKTVQPPDWIGWALTSLGAVLVLHSWGMQRAE